MKKIIVSLLAVMGLVACGNKTTEPVVIDPWQDCQVLFDTVLVQYKAAPTREVADSIINDFVGRIGYLRELEDVYQLGYGIHASSLTENSPIRRNDGTLQPSGTDALYSAVEALVAMPANERRALFHSRREKMLREKIDYAKFLTWFIEEYPQSAKETRDNQHTPDFWNQFK